MALMLTVHPDLCTRHQNDPASPDLDQEVHTVRPGVKSEGEMMSRSARDKIQGG
jgi:hypothetical protein